jgi:hypothetical protein
MPPSQPLLPPPRMPQPAPPPQPSRLKPFALKWNCCARLLQHQLLPPPPPTKPALKWSVSSPPPSPPPPIPHAPPAKIASASALIAHEAAPLPPPSDSSAAATSLPSPHPLPLPAVVPGLSLPDLQSALSPSSPSLFRPRCPATARCSAFESPTRFYSAAAAAQGREPNRYRISVPGATGSQRQRESTPTKRDVYSMLLDVCVSPQVTALLHGITLDVPVRDDCDLCCLFAHAPPTLLPLFSAERRRL